MRDWKNVNNKYVKEGELYLSFDFIKTWDSEIKNLNKKKKGGQYKYPPSLIKFCYFIKTVFGIGFRQEQGLLIALSKYIKIPNIICYSQIQRRTNNFCFDICQSINLNYDKQIIAIDSTGIKLYNSGEWIREKHKKRKPFLKLHIAVNIKTKQAVAIEITEDNISDNKKALSLIDKAKEIKPVCKALLDGAYDTYDIWNGLNARGIRPLIKLRRNAVVKPSKSKTRSKAVKICKDFDMKWPKTVGYGQRWQSETWFSSFKRRFGEHCFSIKPENVIREIIFKAMLCNQLIKNF